MTDTAPIANELRGEIDVDLGGQIFPLRPSHQAIIGLEKQIGKGLLVLAAAADDQTMTEGECAIVVANLIRAWGQATGDVHMRAVKDERIGELIHERGLLMVMPRVALVLALAATGGCLASGELKATTETGTMIPETPGVALPE